MPFVASGTLRNCRKSPVPAHFAAKGVSVMVVTWIVGCAASIAVIVAVLLAFRVRGLRQELATAAQHIACCLDNTKLVPCEWHLQLLLGPFLPLQTVF